MTQLFCQQNDLKNYYSFFQNPPYIKGLSNLSTEIDPDYFRMLGYIWENHSVSFDLLNLYNQIKDYEKIYGKSSNELFNEWKKGTLLNRDIYINHWLNIYLQIKDFIK